MRYREGQTPGELGAPVEMDFTGVGIFGIVLGIGFVMAGIRGRQYWLVLWGTILNLSSLAYVAVGLQ
jgi:hypothetical protein